jgi:hypothetical protein
MFRPLDPDVVDRVLSAGDGDVVLAEVDDVDELPAALVDLVPQLASWLVAGSTLRVDTTPDGLELVLTAPVHS